MRILYAPCAWELGSRPDWGKCRSGHSAPRCWRWQDIRCDGCSEDNQHGMRSPGLGFVTNIDLWSCAQIISSIDSSPEILSQIQEIVIPIIVFTLENRLLDLFDNMYELVDSLTYKLRSISPSMWPVLELTYRLFKHEAVDFLEGKNTPFALHIWKVKNLLPIEMLPSLDNFLSYGADVIKTHQEYK